MSYLVYCTFDLKNASSKDYENAYADLQRIGLVKLVKGDDGQHVVIPTTSTMGFFNGTSVAALRNDVRNAVQAAFRARLFKSEIFVVVGGDWAWGAVTT